MAEIRVLDSHVADLIAAGEVVERPASVAKELMENAIDAGATAVTVEIAHGGMTFLRVTDNGKGIPADQLKTAFLRHATSKLRTEYDLEAIGTLGFRGEALAAISAVARVEVLSRTVEAELGASLSLEGGVPGPVEEAGCPLGTTMVVRDLFFNTPARMKFMKKDAAEGAAVFAVVQREALSHPEISVKFIRDGKQELLTPGDGKLQSAMYAVLGRELALGFRPVKATGDEMDVTGFISLPACCRGSRNWQFFFVNGRLVKSKQMTVALEEAYQNQKMVGKYPGCVLHLTTRLNAVDVNVHPAKTEVKFGNERQVFSAVYHAVLSALEGDRSRPTLDLSRPAVQTSLLQPPPAAPQAILSGPSTPFQGGASRQTGFAVQPHSPEKPEKPLSVPPTHGPSTVRFCDVTTPMHIQRREPPPARQNTPPPPAPAQTERSAPAQTAPMPAPTRTAPPAEAPSAASVPLEREAEPLPLLPAAPDWRVAGEVLNTYIIVEQGDTLLFIDKHAAHERMNFDRMKAEGYDPMAQTLLTPALCRPSPEEKDVLLSHLPLLESFGFDVDELGDSLAVRQAPFDVPVEEIGPTLSEIAQKLLTAGTADPAAARDALLHTMACKAAIKGGWITSPQELQRVAQEVMSGRVKYCPHGRPVAVELTRKDLEKQFRRT